MLRGLLRRFDGEKPVAPKTSRQLPAVPPPAPVRPSQPPKPDYATPPAAPAPSATFAQPAPAPQAGTGEILLPVSQILMTLPLDLRAKIVGTDTTGLMIAVPVDQVLAQLATGSVKITFGELRRLAPGVFASFGGDCDAKPVTLPLNLVLAQLSPALLSRRAAQKKSVELSAEITSPFNAGGQGLTIATDKMKSPPATPPSAAPIPLSRLAPAPEAPAPAPHATQPPPGFTPRWNLPATNGNGNGHAKGAPHAPVLSAAPVPPATASPIPPVAALPEQSQPTISVPLGSLSESWPEALRNEIELLDLTGAQIALPLHLVEPALKRGRVIFSWRCMRPWIKSAAVAVSSHDDLELELPLKVLAPLFFTRKNGPANAQKKAVVSEEIPNLFFGFPQPAAAPVQPAPSAPLPATPALPVPPAQSLPVPHIPSASLPSMPAPVMAASPLPETNFFTRANQPQTSDSEFRRKGGTDFLSRVATPNEIVARAMAMPGVAGVVIALPDGLKVASQIPPDLNGDTLAAFLPQIFARVNQCSRELRMGDMNNLSFTVGNVPWKIFRVNAVYFAAFGRANESLPSSQLAALAVSLDRKKA